jgi:oxygen-independent coproporphyrinogen-3 oxidase
VAGIYLHIPFCRQKCHYCNFFSSASRKLKEPFLQALHKELQQNRGYLVGQTVHTIYFGGGTPSILSPEEIQRIIRTIAATFTVAPHPEITLEANPDDLTEEYLSQLMRTGINRLSIGIQSFFDEDLKQLCRSHTSAQIKTVINKIENVLLTPHSSLLSKTSIDLIYGIPGLSDDRWINNLETAIKYGIPHISAYALTVEDKTALHWMIDRKKFPLVSEEQAARQYGIMVPVLKEAGYEHYEVSNFCKPGYHSKHNTAYWKGVPYLGVGPSAHSYNGTSRRWNVSNISEYVSILNAGGIAYEEEMLTLAQRYNEYVMTGLRTMWGCDGEVILREYGPACFEYFNKCAEYYIAAGSMWQVAGSQEVRESGGQEANIYRLTDEGMLFADGITADFFMEHG